MAHENDSPPEFRPVSARVSLGLGLWGACILAQGPCNTSNLAARVWKLGGKPALPLKLQSV